MSHYFDANPASPLTTRQFEATAFGNQLRFTTASGVFSGGRLDLGTSVLLRTVSPPDQGNILDLGCGFGPIAVALAVASPALRLDAVDVNQRALDLTRLNAAGNGVDGRVNAVTPDGVPAGVAYDQIWSNPPIRIGKAALHELLLTWLPRLKDTGTAYLVVGKNLGADSLSAWLTAQGWPTHKRASAKGFRVLATSRGI
ncbi:MAG: class I SAM-dependent methyltransferase [Arachnia sp.]